MAKAIEFVFNKETGECEVEAQGFKGKGCKAATDPYTNDIFKGQVEIKLKPEFNQAADKVGAR